MRAAPSPTSVPAGDDPGQQRQRPDDTATGNPGPRALEEAGGKPPGGASPAHSLFSNFRLRPGREQPCVWKSVLGNSGPGCLPGAGEWHGHQGKDSGHLPPHLSSRAFS